MLKLMPVSVVLALLATSALGTADDQPDGGEQHWPRAEAIAACKDKSEGAACEFDAPRGHVAGTCRKVRTGDLACVHPHHHHHDAGGEGSRVALPGALRTGRPRPSTLSRYPLPMSASNATESLRRAADLLAAGDWQAAHVIVQDDPSSLAAWMHGIVHLLEGDVSNARYWYRQARRPFPDLADMRAEIEAARAELS